MKEQVFSIERELNCDPIYLLSKLKHCALGHWSAHFRELIPESSKCVIQNAVRRFRILMDLLRNTEYSIYTGELVVREIFVEMISLKMTVTSLSGGRPAERNGRPP